MSTPEATTTLLDLGNTMRQTWRTLNPSGLNGSIAYDKYFATERAGDGLIAYIELEERLAADRSARNTSSGYTGQKSRPAVRGLISQGTREIAARISIEINEEDVAILGLSTRPPSDIVKGGLLREAPAFISPDISLRLLTIDEALLVAREGLEALVEGR